MNARNREQYVAAWTRHVDQLAGLFLAATTDENWIQIDALYQRTRAELLALIQQAADRQKFGE